MVFVCVCYKSLMLGSTVVAPIFVCGMIYFAPESPRWYMSQGRVAEAYTAMRRLRFCDLQASRDLFYAARLLAIEAETVQGRNLIADMWRVPRVRRAAVASGLVMFMQQLCGVNVRHLSLFNHQEQQQKELISHVLRFDWIR